MKCSLHATFSTGAIVADIGSFATRIGYAGDDLPRAYFPTVSQSFGKDT